MAIDRVDRYESLESSVRRDDTMWRPPVRSPFRMRITTLILLTIIVAMGFTIHVQRQREERLRSALRFARNQNAEAIRLFLAQSVALPSAPGMTLETFLVSIRRYSANDGDMKGVYWKSAGRIPIFVDPVGLQESGKTMQAPVVIPTTDQPIGKTLDAVLDSLGLAYVVRDGLLTITSKESADTPFDDGSEP